jgi:hypothetical protein
MSGSAPASAPPSRWRFVIEPRWLGWHLFAVVAVVGMLWLGDWQLHRALGGNALSWAYTFEWPVFAVFGVVFWAKTIIDQGKLLQEGAAGGPADAGDGAAPEAGLGLPGARRRAAALPDDEDEDDPELDQYNAYLDRLNRQSQARGRAPR